MVDTRTESPPPDERSLADRVAELKRANARLEAEKAAAEHLAAARARWLAHVSHELRTPMNGIIGMTELTLETDLTDEQRRHLGLVQRSADSLLTLVNDILDHSKISSRKLTMETIPFSLRDATHDVMATMAATSHDGTVRLETDFDGTLPRRVIGDPGRIRQVIVNLVGNAVKFTERGTIRLSVTAGPAEPTVGSVDIMFTVSDTGIGIPADRLDRVFEPFEQANGATARQYGGTGLGLAISRQLVELMGGRMWVESEVGVGTAFHFTVPLGRAAPTAAAASVDLAGCRVLVLADSPVNQAIVLEVMEQERIAAMVSDDAAETVMYFQKAADAGRPIDMIVADLQRDGMATVEQLTAFVTAPILLLTPAGQRGDAARCRRLGIAAYLTGPAQQGDLADALRAVAAGTQDLVTRHWLRERRNPLRVLIADDSRSNRILLKRMLERQGHTVVAVADGQAAVAAHAAGEFDVVILDASMPGLDGPAAAARMRAAPGKRGAVPIVALTGHVSPDDRERFRAAGMDEVTHKPVQAADLADLLHRLAGRDLSRHQA